MEALPTEFATQTLHVDGARRCPRPIWVLVKSLCELLWRFASAAAIKTRVLNPRLGSLLHTLIPNFQICFSTNAFRDVVYANHFSS
jgi:hypothetical protein